MYGYAHATRQVQNLRVEGPVVAPLHREKIAMASSRRYPCESAWNIDPFGGVIGVGN